MNPVIQFEESARTIWRSDLSSEEKCRRLKGVRSAVLHYVDRLELKRAENSTDSWRIRSFDRMRNYLLHLAADVEELALECERLSSPPPPSMPYAA